MVIADEQSRGMQLILFAYSVLNNIPYMSIEDINYDNTFTNYFYRNGSEINLCVPDSADLRNAATEMGVDHIVWFGYNTDHVQVVSPSEVTRLMQVAAAAS